MANRRRLARRRQTIRQSGIRPPGVDGGAGGASGGGSKLPMRSSRRASLSGVSAHTSQRGLPLAAAERSKISLQNSTGRMVQWAFSPFGSVFYAG